MSNSNTDEYLLVHRTKILSIFKRCQKCGGLADSSSKVVKTNGTLFKYNFGCINGCSFVWESQHNIKSCLGVGNLDASCAITLAGIPDSKFQQFACLMNLKCIHTSTFYDIRNKFITPVVREFWEEEKENVIKNLKTQPKITLIGDGRSDSPGHSASMARTR